MPLGARFPGSGVVLPRRLGREREDRAVGRVGGLSLGMLPRKPIRVILLRYISFSCSPRWSRAPRKRVGAAPQKLLSGGTGTGEPEPERGQGQSRGFAGAGRRSSPEAVPRRRAGQTRDRTDHHFAGGSRRRNAVCETIVLSASAVMEVDAGFPSSSCTCVVSELGDTPESLGKTIGERMHTQSTWYRPPNRSDEHFDSMGIH
jgi:hypothetical protein